jgi:hypothetical protein
LDVRGILEASVSAACIDELTITFLIALKFIVQLELVVFLLMVAIIGLRRHLALGGTICTNQLLLNLSLLF